VKSVGDVRDLSDIERVIVDLIDLFGGASAKAIIADARRSGHSERKARKAISGLSKRGVIEREGA
jgi:DNA-binding transcriptional regulator PaaX